MPKSAAVASILPPFDLAPPAKKGFKSKRKGSRAELRCIRLLEAAGYLCTKAGGSLGLFDVIALGPTGVRAIQVKCGTARLSPVEREAIKELKLADCVSKEYWLFRDRVRQPEVHIL